MPTQRTHGNVAQMLAQAIEAESEAFLASIKGKRLADGRECVMRHDHGPERQVQTRIWPRVDRRLSEARFAEADIRIGCAPGNFQPVVNIRT